MYPPEEVYFIIDDFLNILLDLERCGIKKVILNGMTLVLKRIVERPFPQIRFSPLAFILPQLFEANGLNYVNEFVENVEEVNENQFNYRNDIIVIVQYIFQYIKDEHVREVIDTFISELKSDKTVSQIKENEIIKSGLKQCYFDFEDIKKYELDDTIGHGGYGAVYKGYNKSMKDKFYAIKLSDEKYIPNLISESIILKMSHHPNIPEFISFAKDEEDKDGYLIMELCDTDLMKYLDEYRAEHDHPILYEEACFIFKQIYSALHYLHYELGLIHRDIKLNNILLNYAKENERYPTIKVSDFGTTRGNAKVISTICFTAKFAAPEVGLNREHYDDKVDIFSLGLCLYVLMFGKFPTNQQSDDFMLSIEDGMEIEFEERFKRDRTYRSVISLLMKMIVKKEKRCSWDELMVDEFIQFINK